MIGEAIECGLSGIARRDGADGVARHAAVRLTELDGYVLGARAAAKALAWTEPIELPAGRYEVVLEPTAVADILEILAAAGFNGKAVNEQRSFVRLNADQFDTAITLVDDPLAAGYGYDNEGTPRGRLVLVDGYHQVADPRSPLGGRSGCRQHRSCRRDELLARPRRPPPGRPRPATGPALPTRSTGQSPTRRSPRSSPESTGACWCPTSGTHECSIRERSPSPA